MKIINVITGKELDSGQVIFQDQNQGIEISYIIRLGRGILVRNGDWIISPIHARKELEENQISGLLVVADDCDGIVLSKHHARISQQQRQQSIEIPRQENRRPDFKKLAAGDKS